jgi:hypothetical protein
LAYKNALREALGDKIFNANQVTLTQAAANMNAGLIMMGILGFFASSFVSLGPVMWVFFQRSFPTKCVELPLPLALRISR